MGAQRNNTPPTPLNTKPTSLKSLLHLDSTFNWASTQPKSHHHHHHRPPSPHHHHHLPLLSLITSCSTPCTFTNPSQSPSLKRECLLKLLHIIQPLKSPLPPHVLSSLFNMISSNLFRPLPPPPATQPTACVLLDEDDTTPAPAWPHLTIVYDILLHLVIHLEAKSLAQYINKPFILRLLSLFQSEDTRERESLKNLCHKIYSKFHFSRSFIRKSMIDVFLDYIFETGMDQRHCGIGDMLEIWGTIINGFSIPLKEEHKHFLIKVLIPLHRPKDMQAYHKQLAYCVYQFVEKEPNLGVTVIRNILRYWPKTNCQKEVLLIREVEDLVERMDSGQHRILAQPLCRQMIKCLNSCNLQVAERAHYVWNKEQFVKMAAEAAEQVFPVIVEGIEKNLREHWSASVRELTENVKEMVEGLEPELYAKCLSVSRINKRERWEKVEMTAIINRFVHELQTSSARTRQLK